jgi:hypothetical protein
LKDVTSTAAVSTLQTVWVIHYYFLWGPTSTTDLQAKLWSWAFIALHGVSGLINRLRQFEICIV